jgi:hypothetical protein
VPARPIRLDATWNAIYTSILFAAVGAPAAMVVAVRAGGTVASSAGLVAAVATVVLAVRGARRHVIVDASSVTVVRTLTTQHLARSSIMRAEVNRRGHGWWTPSLHLTDGRVVHIGFIAERHSEAAESRRASDLVGAVSGG